MNEQLIIANKSDITNIADAVREQTGEEDLMSIGEIPIKIKSLSNNGPQIQADLNQNDETAVDYVKNRTHWVEDDGETYHPLDEKFIPDTIATKDYVDDSLGNNLGSEIENYFFIVETERIDGVYYLKDITFDEIIEKFNNGGNMVCHVDGTDYIPLLSVTSYKIIFSGIYNTTSVSLDFNSEGVGNLSTTYLCDRSSLTTHTSDKNIHITVEERELWNSFSNLTIPTDAIILRSSTEGSTKTFKITVDDSGTLSVTENV